MASIMNACGVVAFAVASFAMRFFTSRGILNETLMIEVLQKRYMASTHPVRSVLGAGHADRLTPRRRRPNSEAGLVLTPHRRALATLVAAAQLFAAAHTALVAHTASVSGELASGSFDIIQHLDAAGREGDHAHTPAPMRAPQGEEHCVVASLLRASTTLSAAAAALPARHLLESPLPTAAFVADCSRLERLLAAPKASPPELRAS